MTEKFQKALRRYDHARRASDLSGMRMRGVFHTRPGDGAMNTVATEDIKVLENELLAEYQALTPQEKTTWRDAMPDKLLERVFV